MIMKALITIAALMLTVSCNKTKTVSTTSITSPHDDIIQQDLHNKQRELELLREIRVAQQNNDTEAYEFFMQEFFGIPRLELTSEQKQHPEFKEWLTDTQISSGVFMDSSYNYINKNTGL